MRVVLAPDSFKGSATADEVVHALAAGLRRADRSIETVARPMADGGEGTLAAFLTATAGAVRHRLVVDGPAGPARASWVELPDRTGVVELAAVSGIELLAGSLRPWDAHTIGVGQAIAAALDQGVERLLVGIGSSASTDAGTGLLTALGARFLTAEGRPAAPGARGLRSVAAIDVSRLRELPVGGVSVLCDVQSPLVGEAGAARVFGPQKGFTDAECRRVDADLRMVATLISRALPAARPNAPGAGAAGGAGFALSAWGGVMQSGAAAVADRVGLVAALADADLVVTGEGRFDGQSARGKVAQFVRDAAAEAGVPVAVVAGQVSMDADTSGFAQVVSLTDLAGSGVDARRDPTRWLRRAGRVLAERLRP
ncbi:glycerate kinase [Microbacterium testaceum StLB037]|uniref:Glycerate kinase n=1 Tax=Microbacterium testaceum (strain StLB037) TaxID=979556 RepID=E8N9Y4_MICTS|nr:glycerate kinase [Microbacterium testaceum]BAJ75814.1 glycerate kinase [Microbacterium testaceum StLB037]